MCMKKISIVVPCYNEEENVELMYEALTKELEKIKEKYVYEILFVDNASKDKTREILRTIAEKDKRIKLIFNTRNFGPNRSVWNGYRRTSGDVVVYFPCDFQTPVHLLVEYINIWETGNLIVCGQKNKSKENKIKYALRTIFYKIIQAFSDVPQYEHLIGLNVMDRKVMDVLLKAYEPGIEFRHLVAQLGYKITIVPYEQQKRRAGKSSYNVSKLFDFALTSLINTSYKPLRIATILGIVMSIFSFLIGVVYLVYKLVNWNYFDAGIAPLTIGLFFGGSIQLTFIGLLGEYISVIMSKISKQPLVVEEQIINFDNQTENDV